MNKFNKLHDKIKYKAFGKVTIQNKRETRKETEKDKPKENEKLWEAQVERAEKEIREIETQEGGKVGQVWEMRKRILGEKKRKVEATAIINPDNKKLIVGRNEIKEVTLNYCKETLSNNEPKEEYKSLIEEKKKAVEDLNKETGGEFVVNKEVFYSKIRKFKQSRKKNYDFLTKGGKKFQEAVFKFSQRMCKEEVFPSEFQNTTLHMVFKGKGRKEVLSDNRFIHSKTWLPRLVEGLVVEGGLREALLGGSSMYQIGGQPRHRPEELVFAMKSIIAKQLKDKKPVIIQCYAIEGYGQHFMSRSLSTKTTVSSTRSFWYNIVLGEIGLIFEQICKR